MGRLFGNKSIDEIMHGSLIAKVTAATLKGSLLVGTVLFIIGLALYSNALIGQYITESFGLARSTAVVADRIADTDGLARRVMEIYDNTPRNLRNKQDSREYLDQFKAITEDEGYQRLYRMLGRLCNNSDINYMYVAVYDPETKALIYVCDPDTDPATRCETGQWEIVEGRELDSFTTWDGNGKLYDIGDTPNYGWMCTSGYPVGVRDDHMHVFVLTDVTLQGVWKGIRMLILQYLVAVILVMSFIGWRLNNRMNELLVKPLNKIGDAAKQYVRDRNTGVDRTDHFDNLGIHTGDEIEHLSIIMSDMEHNLGLHEKALVRLATENERVHTEMDLAARIQTNMLPTTFPPFPDRSEIDIYADMDPAKEVGGDFYDFFFIDDSHLAIIMADVAGKGIPASLFMMASMIILGNTAITAKDLDPGEMLETANNMICMHNSADMFVTVWLGILDLETGKITAANAGHEYPAIKHPGGQYEILKDKHGFVLGTMEDMKYTSYELQLEPGSHLFLYTDGLPEASDENDEMFGTERMLNSLNANPDATPEELLKQIHMDVDMFVEEAPQFDDLTMLCIKFNGGYQKKEESSQEKRRKGKTHKMPDNPSKWIPDGLSQTHAAPAGTVTRTKYGRKADPKIKWH